MQKIGESGTLIRSEHFYDEQSDSLIVKYQDDVEAVIDSNRRAQNDFTGFNGSDFHKVAEIPSILIIKWLNEEGLNFYQKEGFEAILKKKLNNPEYAYLKTIPGTI